MKFTALIGAILLFSVIYAASTAPQPTVFTNVGNGCTQPNATSLICFDGAPIQISFVVSTSYSPSYGTFTLTSLNSNISAPVDGFGAPCTVKSGQTNICYTTIAPFSPLLGNATTLKKIPLKLTSNMYPQIYSYDNFTISIHHYLNSSEVDALQSYRNSLSNLTIQKSYYAYVCTGYGICNSTVAESISAANVILLNAYTAFQTSQMSQAFTNTTAAKNAVINSNLNFVPFYARTSAIISNISSAFAQINKTQMSYNSNIATLQNCTYSSSSNAASYVNGRIQYGLSYPAPTTLVEAQAYNSYATGMFQNTTNIIASCKQYHSYSPPLLGISYSLPNIFGGGLLWDAIIIIIIIIAALFIRSRIISRNEMKRIRSPEEQSFDAPKDYSYKDLGEAKEVIDAEVDDDGEYINKVSKKSRDA